MNPFNHAALKRHALKVSEAVRSGKFTRVGQDFYDDMQAEFEAIIRRLSAPVNDALHAPVDVSEDFLTSEGKAKAVEAVNRALASAIHRRALRIRTGKTL